MFFVCKIKRKDYVSPRRQIIKAKTEIKKRKLEAKTPSEESDPTVPHLAFLP